MILLERLKDIYVSELERAVRDRFGVQVNIKFLQPTRDEFGHDILQNFRVTLSDGSAPSENMKRFIRIFGKGYAAAFGVVVRWSGTQAEINEHPPV